MEQPWEGYFPPIKIWGNLYFVGTKPASTHIIDTGDGLIMLDSGYQHSLYLVLYNMYKIGLDPDDLKYIIHTHGHIDHMGATRALVEMTGAKTVIGRADRDVANGKLDLSYAKELGMEYTEYFEPDILLDDGDKFTLGNTVIDCVATPGHTPGAMSYFFDAVYGGESYRVGLQGGMGINTMCREFLDKYGLSYSCRDDFIKAMDNQADIKVDIFLGNHMQHNHTEEKYKKQLDGDERAFIDPDEWKTYIPWAKQNLLNMIERENRQ